MRIAVLHLGAIGSAIGAALAVTAIEDGVVYHVYSTYASS